jgi:hypothetical protein
MVKVGTDGETVAKQAREEPDLDDSVNLATSEFEEDSGEAAELKVKKVAAEKAKEDAAPSFADQNKSEPTIPEESSTLDCKARWKELLVYETSGQSAAALKLLPMFRTGACKSYRPAQEVALKEAELLVASGKRSKARKALKKLRKIPAMEQKAMDMLEELE